MRFALGRKRSGAAWYSLFAIVMIAMLASTIAHGQTESRRFGLGGSVGKFNGFAFRWYSNARTSENDTSATRAIELNLDFEFDGNVVAMSHYVFQNKMPDSVLNYYYGPGIVAGTERGSFLTGISSSAGVLFEKARFDVFMEAFPQFVILPKMKMRLGWTIGLRYYPW